MRKTCLYWSPKQITLLQNQLQRLKSIQAIYSQLIVRDEVPIKFTPKQSYIRLASSESQPHVFSLLKCTIVYCMKLDSSKKNQIMRRYKEAIDKGTGQRPVHVTNDFKEVIRLIVKQLGYDQQNKGNQSSVMTKINKSKQQQQSSKISENRFQKQNQQRNNIKNIPQLVVRGQFIDYKNIKQATKVFALDIPDIQKANISQLSQKLQKELKLYLKYKQIEPLDKQFARLRQSKTLIQLCRSCLHFYTLQKYSLYQNLNFLLRNIRSNSFRDQLQKLKLFAFLMILNFFFIYSGDYGLNQAAAPSILYRYTDSFVEPQLSGQVVTVPSFYSVSAREDIETFRNKNTKIIIHPLAQGHCSLSVKNLFPIHQYSAFKKEQQYLYTPFTCFLVTQVRYRKSQQKWIVIMKQIPGNPIIKHILNINLLNVQSIFGQKSSNINKISGQNFKINQKSENFTSQWQLKCQQRYEFNKDPIIKIKSSFNLGIIFLRFIQKYQISINYFNQAIDLISKLMKPKEINHIAMLIKAHNYLALALMKSGKIKLSNQTFMKAQKLMTQLINCFDEKAIKKQAGTKLESVKSKRNEVFPQQVKYLNAALKNNQSFCLQEEGKYSEAIIKYRQALNILKGCELKNQLMQACISNNIGACVGRSDDKEKKQQAFIYLRDSFYQYLRTYGISLNKINQSPTKQEDNQKTQVQKQNPYKQLVLGATAISESKIVIGQLIPILQNVSEILESVQKIKKAIFFQSSAISLYRNLRLIEEKESEALMFMKSRLAKLMAKNQQFKKAIQIYEELIPIARMTDDANRKLATIKSNIASAYVNMGTDQDFKSAVFWYNEAIQDISKPLLNENLQLYNNLCDMRNDIEKYCVNVDK